VGAWDLERKRQKTGENHGRLTIDGAKDIIDGLRSIVKGHDDSLVVSSVGGSG